MRLAAAAIRTAASARKIAPGLAVDTVGLAGCGLIVYGIWLVFPPAGFVTAGVMLAAGAWLLARRN